MKDIREDLFKAQEHISSAIKHLQELEKLKEQPKAIPFPTNSIPREDLNVAICVGHSRQGDTGAVSCGGINEWTYNKKVAEFIYRRSIRRNLRILHVFDELARKTFKRTESLSSTRATL